MFSTECVYAPRFFDQQDGKTALDLAIQAENSNVVELLLVSDDPWSNAGLARLNSL